MYVYHVLLNFLLLKITKKLMSLSYLSTLEHLASNWFHLNYIKTIKAIPNCFGPIIEKKQMIIPFIILSGLHLTKLHTTIFMKLVIPINSYQIMEWRGWSFWTKMCQLPGHILIWNNLLKHIEVIIYQMKFCVHISAFMESIFTK